MNDSINKIISIILSVIFGFTLLFGFILLVIRNSVSVSMVTDLLKENVFTYVEVVDKSNTQRMALNYNDVASQYTNIEGLDKDVINEIINSSEFQDAIEVYKNEITDYLTGKSDKLEIDNDVINSTINNAIEEYKNRTGKDINIDTSKLNEEINKALDELSSGLTTVKENKMVTRGIDIIFGSTVFYVLVVLNFVFAIAIFLVNMNLFKTLKYLSIPTIVVSVILLLLGLITGNISIDVLDVVLNNLSSNFYTYGFINLVVGIIALILGIVCGKEKKVVL